MQVWLRWLHLLVMGVVVTLAANSPTAKDVSSEVNSTSLTKAVHFISLIQQSCARKEYILIRSGINGGFSAQFQLLASKFMVALASGNFEIPVLITGPLNGYSNAAECKHYDNQWTCYFSPSSPCHSDLLGTGKEIASTKRSFEDSIPQEFRALGYTFWWGAIQHYLFQFQPYIINFIREKEKHLSSVHWKGIPVGIPIVGIHARRGDKKYDGFSSHSLNDEMSLLRNSSLCKVQNEAGDCFLPINFRSNGSPLLSGMHNYPLTVLREAIHGHTVIIRKSFVNEVNFSRSISSNQKVDPHVLLRAYHARNRFESLRDSNQTLSTSRQKELQGAFRVLDEEFVFPLPIFVASDDRSVLEIAKQRGLFTGSEGVSQQVVERTGMLHSLLKNSSISFNAAKEIVFDLHQLSKCQVLIGSASSQVFRIAVALSNTSRHLIFAKVIDSSSDLERVVFMSQKYHIPFPEHFDN